MTTQTNEQQAVALTDAKIESIGKRFLDHGFHKWEGLQPWVYQFARAVIEAHTAELVAESERDDAVISAYAIPMSEGRFASEVLIQRSRQIEGPAKWAVRLNGDVLNKSGEWELEPMPSSRDDEFLARCRFDTASEAIAAARAAMKKGGGV